MVTKNSKQSIAHKLSMAHVFKACLNRSQYKTNQN